jgi:hypothetical protein
MFVLFGLDAISREVSSAHYRQPIWKRWSLPMMVTLRERKAVKRNQTLETTHTRVSHVPNRNSHRVSRGIFSFNYYTISIHDSSKLKIIAEALAEQRQLLCGETTCYRCSTHSTRYIRHTIRYLGTACGIFDEVAELLLTGSLMVRSNSSGARE